MMFRLGLQLALQGGKEALTRLLLIASAVAIGVAVLLSVLADFHGFQSTNGRQCWQCTSGPAVAGRAPAPGGDTELWNYRQDYYQGRTIERLDVAALGPDAPVLPGLKALPAAGEYYASPAMAKLLGSVPADQLGDRFPGRQVGLIGDDALGGPDDLTIFVGGTPDQLAALPATMQVKELSTKPELNSATNLYQFGFGMAAIALVFPLLTLIGTATRLAAARREERFAAFRLVGATSRQVSVIASVDAVAGALVGAVAGVGIFQLLQPAVAKVPISGALYFSSRVAPTLVEYIAVLVGVPIASAVAALWSLQRVRISPLGAVRRTTPPAPGVWRLLPLVVGLAMLIAAPLVLQKPASNALSATGELPPGPSNAALPFTFIGLALTMLGLVLSGSWLTMQGARFVAKSARGASGVLSARRLADNPKAAFRSVSGLVLAVFVGTTIAGVVPAVNSGMKAVGGGTLTSVLRTSFMPEPGGPDTKSVVLGLPSATSTELLSRMRSYPGADVLPMYATSARDAAYMCVAEHQCGPTQGTIVCKDLERFSALGECASGATAVRAQFGFLLSHDDPSSLTLPFVAHDTPTASGDVSALPMEAVLIKTADAETLEKIRTLLVSYTAQSGSTTAPKTFGEGAHRRSETYGEIQQITLAVVAVTLIVAGCSLAVAVGGGLLERRRPFTLLRLAGTPSQTLYRVVVFESAVPLALAALVAAVAGYGTAASVIKTLVTNGVSVALPGKSYFLTLGGGLLASFAVVLTALPLLKRITQPDDARFE
ncbi:FtsX-like permease family protein [Kitasatospora aureofaciens]|uniref:FtsX-like permease family protein n=1 Tax=Kitasatospora aureofaciens TaxID=1894 RepID=UPI0037C9CC70